MRKMGERYDVMCRRARGGNDDGERFVTTKRQCGQPSPLPCVWPCLRTRGGPRGLAQLLPCFKLPGRCGPTGDASRSAAAAYSTAQASVCLAHTLAARRPSSTPGPTLANASSSPGPPDHTSHQRPSSALSRDPGPTPAHRPRFSFSGPALLLRNGAHRALLRARMARCRVPVAPPGISMAMPLNGAALSSVMPGTLAFSCISVLAAGRPGACSAHLLCAFALIDESLS